MKGIKIFHTYYAKRLSTVTAKNTSIKNSIINLFHYLFLAFKEKFKIATYQDYDESQILHFEIHRQPRSFYQD